MFNTSDIRLATLRVVKMTSSNVGLSTDLKHVGEVTIFFISYTCNTSSNARLAQLITCQVYIQITNDKASFYMFWVGSINNILNWITADNSVLIAWIVNAGKPPFFLSYDEFEDHTFNGMRNIFLNISTSAMRNIITDYRHDTPTRSNLNDLFILNH